MPGWLLSLIISLALRIGLSWLVKRFPGIPPEIIRLLEDFIKVKKDPEVSREEKKQAEVEVRKKVRDICSGIGCPPDLKRS